MAYGVGIIGPVIGFPLSALLDLPRGTMIAWALADLAIPFALENRTANSVA